MSKKIAIIGNTGHGTSVAAKAKDTLVVVDGDGEALAINGTRYVPIKRTSSGTSSAMVKLMSIATMFGGMPAVKTPERPDVDIPMEFALIQRKQSNLSRSQRDWVEDVFHANFKKL